MGPPEDLRPLERHKAGSGSGHVAAHVWPVQVELDGCARRPVGGGSSVGGGAGELGGCHMGNVSMAGRAARQSPLGLGIRQDAGCGEGQLRLGGPVVSGVGGLLGEHVRQPPPQLAGVKGLRLAHLVAGGRLGGPAACSGDGYPMFGRQGHDGCSRQSAASSSRARPPGRQQQSAGRATRRLGRRNEVGGPRDEKEDGRRGAGGGPSKQPEPRRNDAKEDGCTCAYMHRKAPFRRCAAGGAVEEATLGILGATVR